MTLNQLLVELDGFAQNEGIIIIAATNLPELLDPALVRPGRFDTHVAISLPDIRGRENILKAHSRKLKFENPDDLLKIAQSTPGLSGADLSNLLNQAAVRASILKKSSIAMDELEWAKDKILMGSERKSIVMSEKELKLTAYHEAGHAICALYEPGAIPLYKATIIPRGSALGMITQMPEEDMYSFTRQQMHARLVVAMGGRAAEEKIFGRDHVTSGASSDVDQATRLARNMVMRYAMSDKVGPINIDQDTKLSAATQALVDEEVKALLTNALARAHALLDQHARAHDTLAKALLEHETLNADEVRAVIAGKLKRQVSKSE